ncbi:MAG: TrbI/VirB10 family protein [Terriglobia bacterium]|jgi:type IV secretion system protein VirB10|nr:TrbI/VirB10 family protein [Terriglobia bacterium]
MTAEKPTLAADTVEPPSSEVPELRDRRPKPEGVVPKQSQAYVIAGLAVLILLAVMFSNNRAKPAAKPSAAAPAVFSSDANQRNIDDLKRDLTEEQRKSEQQAQSQKAAGAGASSLPGGATQPGATTNNNSQPPTEPPRDPVKDAERALNFKARFASNLVPVSDATAHSAATQSLALGCSLEGDRTTSAPATAVQSAGATQQNGAPTKRAPEVSVNSAYGQPYVLFEGTTIDTALVNRLDGEFSGPVKVMVTNPVYSQDRQHVLIPEGTFILGDVQKVSGFGQKRLAIVFHRMLMPDGYSVDLDQFHGLDQVGETGPKDKVNNHYLEVFGASIALGIISGTAEASTNGGYNQSGSDMYRQGVASSLSQESAHVLDRFINVPPTLTIREGHRIKVYLTQDLLLPAYENHTIPPNI